MTDRHSACRRLRQAGVVLFFSLAGSILTQSAAAAAPAAPAAAGATGADSAAGTAPRQQLDETDRVVLPGTIHPRLRTAVDLGRTAADRPMKRIVLVLGLRPGARADLDTLLAAQADPASPLYHKWLTPNEFGARFGASRAAVANVAAWLVSHGFTIDEVARGRGWINFSGTARQVEETFDTEMHDYDVAGTVHHANALQPSIPRALAGVIQGIVSLNDFRRPPLHHRIQALPAAAGQPKANPNYSSAGFNYLAPADFATIYGLGSVYGNNLTGSGQAIAIVARTDILLSDVAAFRSVFNLPANDPVVAYNGATPGDLGGDEETEADLDTEWSGAVAPNATVYLVVSASTDTTDGVDLSAQFIVDNNLAPVMSTSFGSCEAEMNSDLAFYNNLWSQAASQGITSMVAAGDAGAAGCQTGGDTTGTGRAVNGLCSTKYDVCVGGTEFMDANNPAAYWSSTNNQTTLGSALSYIPEMAWNESGTVSGGGNLWATGGGASSVYTKPTWQVAPGVPADGLRDVPDVALTAAGHDGYLVMQDGLFTVVGGTSAASPSFAGLMSLVVQQTAARQGNANTVLYPLAASQYGSSHGPAVFHDVTTGNNSVPGVTGYACTTAYDQATGLGSVNAAQMVASWTGSAGSAGCQAPAAPTDLFATASGTSGVQLAWNAVSGATQYTVLRSTSGSGGPYDLAGLVTNASFSDGGLTCGATYDYQVVASNGTCASARSATAAANACVTPLRFYTVPPCRVFDTRQSASLAALTTTAFQVTGACGIPSTAQVVSANLTIVAPTNGGYLTLFPAGAALPPTSTLNFRPGQTRANIAMTALGAAGQVDVYVGMSGTGGSTNVLLDVNGYYQ
jgi:pseudomonalisin